MIRLASKKSMAKDTEAEYSKWSYGRFMTLRKRKTKINAEIKEKRALSNGSTDINASMSSLGYI